MPLPLEGVTIIELSHYIAGPLCGQTLADYGATVIKIEPPGGEPSRKGYPMHEGKSAYFAGMNRGKTFHELDLKSESGRQALYDLVDQADGFITNYAAGVPERLGVGHEQLQARNPRLVYTQITGFGAAPGNPTAPAYDGAIQAMSGIAHMTGDPAGPPMKAGLFIADNLAAWVASSGMLAALFGARATGRGEYLDISMLDAMFSLQHFNLSLVREQGADPMRAGNRSTNVFCTTFPTSDGWCYIAPIPLHMWRALCEQIGRPELAAPEASTATNDGRLANYDELEQAVADWTRTKTTDELVEILTDLRIAHGPVLSPREITNLPLMRERGMLTVTNFEGVDFTVPSNPVSFTRSHVPQEATA